jgi:AraC family ethanolamine operon transcriptional activator
MSVGSFPDPAPDVHGTWRHVARSADVDAHAQSQPQWDLQYDQLSCGRFTGFVHHVQLPGLRVIHEVSSQAVHQHGLLREEAYSFGMPTTLEGRAFFNGQSLGANGLMLGRGDELDLCSPVNFGLIAIVVDAPLLESLVTALHDRPVSRTWSRQVVASAEPARAARVRTAHLDVLESIQGNPRLLEDPVAAAHVRDSLLIDWLAVLPTEFDFTEADIAAARRRLVARACALLLAHPDEPMSLSEACTRIGASRRKLDYCFQDTLGTSPARYLRAVRLNSVRRALQRPAHDDVAVLDVAARWGFWHPGEFSAAYKQQFEELPSATLKRALERA